MDKQATERRRTKKFLAFSLGKREEKSDSEILMGVRTKGYNP
jgi:hypothetical protein